MKLLFIFCLLLASALAQTGNSTNFTFVSYSTTESEEIFNSTSSSEQPELIITNSNITEINQTFPGSTVGPDESDKTNCINNEVDWSDICSPQICTPRGWMQTFLDCKQELTPCSCCGNCKNVGIFLRGPTAQLQGNAYSIHHFLSECSTKLDPVKCLTLSPKRLEEGIINLELQGTSIQLSEIYDFVNASGFFLSSFPGPYTFIPDPNPPEIPRNEMLIPRYCALQDHDRCHGLAIQGDNERAVCAWSPLFEICGIVKPDEEIEENDRCVGRSFFQCSGLSSTETVDLVCAWKPQEEICVEGYIDIEIDEKQVKSMCEDSLGSCYFPCTWDGSKCVPVDLSSHKSQKTQTVTTQESPKDSIEYTVKTFHHFQKQQQSSTLGLWLFPVIVCSCAFGICITLLILRSPFFWKKGDLTLPFQLDTVS